MEVGKARMNAVRLNWNQRHQQEPMIFKNRETEVQIKQKYTQRKKYREIETEKEIKRAREREGEAGGPRSNDKSMANGHLAPISWFSNTIPH